MAIELQQATESDLAQLLEMMRDFYAHERIAFDHNASLSALTTLRGDGDRGEVLLIRDDETIGYAVIAFMFSLEFRGLVAFVDELYVIERRRARGVGSVVLAELEARCRRRGITALRLEVDHSNDAARRLYERIGFVGESRAIMTLRL